MHAGQVAPPFVPIQAVQHGDAQMRRETVEFRGPVRHQAGRHDNQCRPIEATGGFLDDDMSDGLRGLAQAHVVGEQPAKTVFPQVLQPVDALLLIGAQAGV